MRDWAGVAGRGWLLLSGSVAHASLKSAVKVKSFSQTPPPPLSIISQHQPTSLILLRPFTNGRWSSICPIWKVGFGTVGSEHSTMEPNDKPLEN